MGMGAKTKQKRMGWLAVRESVGASSFTAMVLGATPHRDSSQLRGGGEPEDQDLGDTIARVEAASHDSSPQITLLVVNSRLFSAEKPAKPPRVIGP